MTLIGLNIRIFFDASQDMGHVNHLSVGMIRKAKEHGAKVVFTLHDFWMMCPRGQFLETGLDGGEPWKVS